MVHLIFFNVYFVPGTLQDAGSLQDEWDTDNSLKGLLGCHSYKNYRTVKWQLY